MTFSESEHEEQKRKILQYRTGDLRDPREMPSSRRSQAPHVIVVVGEVFSGKTSFINLLSQATSERNDNTYRPRSYVARMSEENATLRTEMFKLTESVYAEDRPGLPKRAPDQMLAKYLHAAVNGIQWSESEFPQHRVPVALSGVSSKDISLIAFCVSGTDLIPHMTKKPDESTESPAPSTKNWKQAQQIMAKEHGGLPFVFVVTKIDLVAEALNKSEAEAARMVRDTLSGSAGCSSSAVIVIRSYTDEYDAPRDMELEHQGLQALERLLFWCDSYIRFDEPPPMTRIAEMLGLCSNSQTNRLRDEHQHLSSPQTRDLPLGTLLLKQMFFSLVFVVLVLCAVLGFVVRPFSSSSSASRFDRQM